MEGLGGGGGLPGESTHVKSLGVFYKLVGELHCRGGSCLGSKRNWVSVGTSSERQQSSPRTCDPIHVRTTKVGHSTIMTDGMDDKC